MTEYSGPGDVRQAARGQVVEGARLVVESLEWLSQEARYPNGGLNSDSCFWMALAGLAATVAGLAESAEHPCHTAHLAECCDGAESSVLMLRAVHALRMGDRQTADEYARLGASMWNKEER